MTSRHFPAWRSGAQRILLASVLGLPAMAAPGPAADPISPARSGSRGGIVLLSTGAAPDITGHPQSQAVVVDLPASLEVFAEGEAPLSYAWWKDGVRLESATNIAVVTNATLAIDPVTTNDAGVYAVTVSNAFGAVLSEPAALILLPNPSILQQPEGQTVIEGATVGLTVEAAGTSPLSYYWDKDGTNLTDQTGATVFFAPVSTNHAGVYRVMVSNAVGTATSQLAVLVVKPNTPRQLRSLDLELPGDGRAKVPVQFAAQGDEQRLGFSLRFDPLVLQGPAATLTPEAELLLPGATVEVNDLETAQGRIGFSVTLPPGNLMPTQTFRLADFSFTLANPAWQQAGLAFVDSPVLLVAADRDNRTLPVLDVVDPILTIGPMPAVPDGQSGLFQQRVTLVNPGATKMAGLEVVIQGLTNDSLGIPLRVANASGATNGVPLVYYGPLFPGAQVDLTVEFYVADRRTQPTPDYEARIVAARQFTAGGGLTFTITNVRFADNRVLVEFLTVAGRQYFIQYVDQLGSTAWKTAVPGVLGTGTRIQWLDDGPPKTISRPAHQRSRFYRGMLMP